MDGTRRRPFKPCRAGAKKDVQKLFEALGYTKYYHGRLLSHSSSIKLSAAADKLGRMGDPTAIEPLFKMLKHKKAEVATVALRAMCRIGTKQTLQLVLEEVPLLIKNEKVSIKAIQTSLLLFEPWAGELLLAFAGRMNDPIVIALILETLTAFPAGTEMFTFALTQLTHPDPEVRGKALRVLARAESESFVCSPDVFTHVLNDPVWFVRLQAAKAIGTMKCENFIEMLKILALDERWQVRDAATFSLVSIGDASIDTFLELLETPDRYAKESISEEIQRTGFVLDLIEYLGRADNEKRAKAERILTLMHQLGFSSSILEYVQTHKNRPDITVELTKILRTGGVQ